MASELNINISSIPYIGTYVPFPEPEERPDPIIPDPGNSLSWVHVSLKQTAQESIPRIPSDVVMVIDNSGSMGESSRVEANGEYSPLNLLDIVKHAVRTVVATLGEHDRLSIVQFSNDARIVCDLTYMTNDEKTRILALVDRMEPDEATNLWDGLRTGISILNNANRSMPQHNGRGDIVLTTPPSKKRNSAVMLLTDGQPTSDLTPREGIIEAMKNYITYVCNGQCPGIISTFGFSYGCEYDLMRDIAFEGGGMYSFIPDSGFVGTAFINSLANTLSTFTNDARLEITGQNGTLFHDVKWANPYKFVYNPYKYTTIIGSLQVEQTRDIIVLVEHPSTVTSNFVKVRLDCHVVDSTLLLTETSVPTVLEKEGPAPGSNTDEMCAETTLQFYRQVVVDLYHKLDVSLIRNLQPVARQQLAEGVTALTRWIDSNQITMPPEIFRRAEGLLKDLTGQCGELCSRMEFYYKWGRHYMPSVQRAHGIQQSNNFKDPGIQFYGGRLFLDVQADADDIFNSLPAPVPKHPIYQYGGGVAAAPAPVATTMASYNDRDAGCVHGDCSVVVVGSAYGNEVNFSGTKEVAVKDLKKGDIVRCSSPDASNSDDQKKLDIYGVVECVVELKCKQQKSTMQMVTFPNGLRITPWHPIRQEGSWKFPADLYPIEEVTCDSVPAVYCLVVRHLFTQADSDKQLETYQAAIMVNGIECATLGHGVIDDKVASHCFFGESSLVDLRQCQGWESGHVVFGTDCFVRDKASHLVTAFDLSKEILTTLLM